MKKDFLLLSAYLLFGTAPFLSALSLPAVFSDGMVLQQQSPIPVWGVAAPGEKIEIRFAGEQVECTADDQGGFQAELPPLPVNSEPQVMQIRGAVGEIILKDILVGEVWFCCGQSNMEFPLDKSYGGTAAAATVSPLIRTLRIEKNQAAAPQRDARMTWIKGGRQPEQLSGVAFFFASQLQQEQKVPVGVILAAVGSTRAEDWTAGTGAYFNGMVAPIGRFPMRGIIYYQGESNVSDAENYYAVLGKCINGFRRNLNITGNPFPLLLVQIAPFGYDAARAAKLPLLQSIQEKFALDNGFQLAVISDAGDFNTIHPTDKKTVGVRLAHLAEITCYHPDCGRNTTPVLQSCRREGKYVRVVFSNVSQWKVSHGQVTGFEVAGADGKFHNALVEFLPGGALRVFSAQVPEPQTIRYMWRPHYRANLYNEEGFPPGCFRQKLR